MIFSIVVYLNVAMRNSYKGSVAVKCIFCFFRMFLIRGTAGVSCVFRFLSSFFFCKESDNVTMLSLGPL